MKVRAIDIVKSVRCSKANVSKETKNGKLAILPSGEYETTDPTNSAWLRARGVNPENLASLVGADAEKIRQTHKRNPGGRKGKTKTQDVKPEPPPASEPEPPRAEILPPVAAADFETLTGLPARFMNLTLKELVLKHGTEMQLKGWADILNTVMSAMKRDVDIQEKRNDLIPKDFIITYVFQYLDTLSEKLFDHPESIIDIIISEIKSDSAKARLTIPEKLRRDYSRIIKESKKNILSSLKKLRRKYDEKQDE